MRGIRTGTKFRRWTMEGQGPSRGAKRPQTCTFVVVPAEDLRLVPVADVENLIRVFRDGHVGGA